MTNKDAHPYFRFKLKMPSLDEHDKEDLEHARNNATNLTRSQLKRLKNLVRFTNVFRFVYFPINAKILLTFYDLGLFVGSTHLWCETYKWILLKDKRKYEDLDLNLTLVVLTGALAGSNGGLGAERWYRMGVTRKLLKRLIKRIEAEQKHDRNN